MNIFLPTKLRTNKRRRPNRTVFFLFCRNSNRPVYSHHFSEWTVQILFGICCEAQGDCSHHYFLTLLRRTGPAVEVCKTASVVGIIFLMALLPRSVLVCTMLAVGTKQWHCHGKAHHTVPSVDTAIYDLFRTESFFPERLNPLFHWPRAEISSQDKRKIPPADR